MPASVSREQVRALRGTKRSCQNSECGSRFYDLNKEPITCPVCGSVYELAIKAVPAPAPERRPRPAPKRYEPEEAKPAPEEELAAVAGEETAADGEGDDFLEEMEEEPSNVSGIIDAPIEDGDEKT
jgi:uncharacterized protein (TIGR02300 family)